MSELFAWECDNCKVVGRGAPMLDAKGRARVRGPGNWYMRWDEEDHLPVHFCNAECAADYEAH